MKGIELAKQFYDTFGATILEGEFKEVSDRIAVGLVGEGSECLGFDDEISHDHDFEPGFCMWITKEDEQKFGFRLERAYSRLPKEFLGFKRQPLSPVGGNRHGVLVIEDFYRKFLGTETVPKDELWWLDVPATTLRTATNGEVWRDELGIFSSIRGELLKGYPEDVRRKKIAAHTLMLAQSGQYNLPRSLKRGDIGAAQLCVSEFVRHTISLVYLLNNVYEPFYKWAYRGMRELEKLSELEPLLISLADIKNAEDTVEQIALMLSREFVNQGLTPTVSAELASNAYQITDTIKSGTLRNMHILEGI